MAGCSPSACRACPRYQAALVRHTAVSDYRCGSDDMGCTDLMYGPSYIPRSRDTEAPVHSCQQGSAGASTGDTSTVLGLHLQMLDVVD